MFLCEPISLHVTLFNLTSYLSLHCNILLAQRCYINPIQSNTFDFSDIFVWELAGSNGSYIFKILMEYWVGFSFTLFYIPVIVLMNRWRNSLNLRFILPCKSECQPIFQIHFRFFKLNFWNIGLDLVSLCFISQLLSWWTGGETALI